MVVIVIVIVSINIMKLWNSFLSVFQFLCFSVRLINNAFVRKLYTKTLALSQIVRTDECQHCSLSLEIENSDSKTKIEILILLSISISYFVVSTNKKSSEEMFHLLLSVCVCVLCLLPVFALIELFSEYTNNLNYCFRHI